MTFLIRSHPFKNDKTPPSSKIQIPTSFSNLDIKNTLPLKIDKPNNLPKLIDQKPKKNILNWVKKS